MQTYRRFVSYVYQYENGKKAGNRGFIKVEARGNTCSMQIALKGICRDGNGSCKVYGFKREEGLLKGSLLAECPVRTGIVQEQLGFLRNEMGEARYSLHELSGVIFRGDDETMYGTQWDDAPMKMENFQPDERGMGTAAKEEIPEGPQEEELPERDLREEDPQQEESFQQEEILPEESPQETESMEQEAQEVVWEAEAPVQEEPVGEQTAQAVPAESEIEGAASSDVQSAEAVPEEEDHTEEIHAEEIHAERIYTEEGPQEEPSPGPIQAKGGSIEGPSTEAPSIEGSFMEESFVEETPLRGPFIEDPSIESPFMEAPVTEVPPAEERPAGEMLPKEPDGTNAPGADGQPSGEGSAEPPRTGSGDTDPAPQWQEEGLPEVLDTTVVLPDAVEATDVAQGSLHEDGEKDDEAEELPGDDPEDVLKNIAHIQARAEMEAEDIQEQSASKKDTFCPFTDGVLEDCRKISMDDLRYLDPRDQGLRNNRFVQHGYQMFGHLLLAKVARNSQYILGVPGMYQKQERFTADMYGFHNFKCARRRGNRPACFGYWYRLIYPPQLDRRDGRQE